MQKNISTQWLFFLFIITAFLSNFVVYVFFPDRVISEDLIFKIFPYSLNTEYIADIIFLLGIILFIVFYVFKNRKDINNIVNVILIMYILRAVIMIFTPLMRPTGVDMPSHGLFREYMTQLGMFPSGHVALIATMFFEIKGKRFEVLKKVMMWILILLSIFMIMSRGHYTIDVIGGIMLAYIVVNEYKEYLKRI